MAVHMLAQQLVEPKMRARLGEAPGCWLPGSVDAYLLAILFLAISQRGDANATTPVRVQRRQHVSWSHMRV
jgi:hypothetical protein